MNMIFGQSGIGARGLALGAQLNEFIRTHHRGTPHLVDSKGMDVLVGELRNGGRVIGRASEDRRTLLFAGFFLDSIPGWTSGSPLEDPDVTAAHLLRRYRAAGTSFLDGVPGHFGLAVLDAEAGSVHLAADPHGQRTLYVSTRNGRLTFGSNLSTVCHLLGEDLRLDRRWEDFFLIYGFYPFGLTPFANVAALPPGQLLTWRDSGVEIRSIAPGVAPLADDLADEKDFDRAVDVLYEGFMRALEEQSAGVREAGVLLGGFDSALVAAGLHRLGKRVSTWSFHYDAEQFNQPHTDDVARALGARHEWVHISPGAIRDGLEQFAYRFNQPTNWPNYVIQTALVCERMREAGVQFAYSGDGCDTVFLGYPGTWRRARVLRHMPGMSRAVSRRLTQIMARPFLERHVGHPYRVALNLVRTAAWPRHARGFLSFRIMDEVSVAQLRKAEPPPDQDAIREAVETLARPHAGLPGLRLAYLGKSSVSPNRNKMCGSSDLSGIPILSPYMHPGFKALAQRLPEELCRPRERTASHVTGKYILMKMATVKDLLPPAVIHQKKMAAVDAPIDAWYAGPLRTFMLDGLRSLPFDADHGYLGSLLDPHLAERLFQRYLLTDKVIKHAPSLLATYARFCALAPAAHERGVSTKT